MRRSVCAVLAAFGAVMAMVIVAPATASAATTSALVNFTASGQQIIRFDTHGNAVDAHDGEIARFANTYYLYGTSYDCGYRWHINSRFCGFKVYSSTDLVHWTDRGLVVPPFECTDCFRPHVLYNAATDRYVLWANDQAATSHYDVYTAPAPTGPFQKQAAPHLAAPCTGGDFTIFEDDDGAAYFACRGFSVERLTSDYLSGAPDYVSTGVAVSVEAPALFKRHGIYYLTMSDPACGYCRGTGTGYLYLKAASPLGPWTGASTQPASGWSIQDGQLLANGGGVVLSSSGSSWGDYTYAADVTPLQTGSGAHGPYAQAGMAFRFDAAGNGYVFLLSNYPYTSPAASGYVVFLKYVNGVAVSARPAALPFAVTGGTAYQVAITASGSTYSVGVDGTTVDTVTDASYATGRVGFRESSTESAEFDNVAVTAPDGTSMLTDDFSTGLSNWAIPQTVTPFIASTDSCGGQPSFVTTLPGRGGPIYLYASDLWDGNRNEGLANYFWTPLQFDANGLIAPITCPPSATVNLAIGFPGNQDPVTDVDQTSGIDGFTAACTITAATEQMQTFTAGRTGTLREVRLTSFQQSTSDPGGEVDAPLTLQLVTLTPAGSPAQVLAQQVFEPGTIGWSARDLVMNPNVPVANGSTYALLASSDTTQGCYGIVGNDQNPYASGQAATSTDSGQTFTPQPARDLKFLTEVTPLR